MFSPGAAGCCLKPCQARDKMNQEAAQFTWRLASSVVLLFSKKWLEENHTLKDSESVPLQKLRAAAFSGLPRGPREWMGWGGPFCFATMIHLFYPGAESLWQPEPTPVPLVLEFFISQFYPEAWWNEPAGWKNVLLYWHSPLWWAKL